MALLTDAVSVHQLWNEEDSHRFGYDFTEVGSPTYGDGFVEFNGSSSYLTQAVAVGSGFNIGSSDWAMSLRFRYNSGDTGGSVYIAGLDNLDWRITKTNTERIKFEVNKVGGGTVSAELVGPYVHSTWYHLIVWFNASTQTIGIRLDDTDEDATSVSANVLDRATNFRLGAATASFHLDGDIGDVRVRKGSLWTSSEITTLYNSGNLLPYYADGTEVFLEGDHLSDTRGQAFAQFTESGGVTHVSGLVGNAFDFSGSSQRIDTPNHYFKWLTARSFHMVAWVRLDAVGSAQGLFGQSTSSYHCHVLSSNKVRFQAVSTVSTNNRLDSTAALSVDTWTRISCGYDAVADEIFLQINEGTKEVIDMSGEDIAPSASNFHLGAITTSQYLNGKIDQFKMRVGGTFSTSELSDHYNSGSGAAEKTEIELDYNYSGSTAKRVKVQAKSTGISGSGSQDCLILTMNEDVLPAELIDSDELGADGVGGRSLRASSDEAGANMLPLYIIDFTPAPGGGTAEIKINTGTLDGTSGTDVYLWWFAEGHEKYLPPAANVYGRDSVPNNGFVHYFLMNDDPTGTITDITGNGETPVSVGTMASGDVVTGKVGSATDFDGINGGYQISSPTFPAAGNDFALGAWVKPVDQAGSGFPSIAGINHAHGGILQGMFFDYNDSTDKFRFSVRDNSGSDTFTTATSTTSVNFGIWQHVVGKFDDSAFESEIFYDGSSEDTTTGSGTRFTASSLYTIAHGRVAGVSTDFFEGVVDEKWLYNGEITGDQVTTLYNNQNDPATFWDHSFAVTSPGSSGNNVTGSITQGGQTFSGTVTTTVSASGVLTQGAVSLSGTATVEVSASGTLTQGGQALAGSIETDSAVDLSGALTQGAQQLSGTAEVVVSTSGGLTQGGQVISGSATITLSVSGSLTQGGQTVTGSVTGPIIAAYATGTTSVFARATGTISINP